MSTDAKSAETSRCGACGAVNGRSHLHVRACYALQDVHVLKGRSSDVRRASGEAMADRTPPVPGLSACKRARRAACIRGLATVSSEPSRIIRHFVHFVSRAMFAVMLCRVRLSVT